MVSRGVFDFHQPLKQFQPSISIMDPASSKNPQGTMGWDLLCGIKMTCIKLLVVGWRLKTSRRGKTAPAVVSVLKKMSLSPKRNYWSIQQKVLKIPREFEVHFWRSPAIHREFGVENSRDAFLLSRGHALLQRATSDLQKVFLHVRQVNMINVNTPQPKTWRRMCMCGKLSWTFTLPTQDVT